MNCPKCGSEMADGSAFCTKCGASLAGENAQAGAAQQNLNAQQGMPQQNATPQMNGMPQGNPNPQMNGMPQGGPNPQMNGMPYGNPNPQQGMPQQPYYDPKDHTGEFDAKDISDNKVMAMMPYLMGTVGIIIALLASRDSAYTAFHVRQALKITVVSALVGIITALLFWTVIVPIAGGICLVILFVVRIICFFQICSGKAKEPAIISSFGFLK